jgi:hypothetical protein
MGWEVSSIAVGGPPVLLPGLLGDGTGDEFQGSGTGQGHGKVVN